MTITPHPSLDVVTALLTANGLPAGDVTPDMLAHFFVADEDGEPRGLVGLQIAAGAALLRSLAVTPAARGLGLGGTLVQHAEAHACAKGIDTVYLLTTDAAPFFARHGYVAVDRASAPAGIRETAQFSSIVCSSATLMRRSLPA